MGDCGDERRTPCPFEKALDDLLSYREAMDRRARAPVKRWAGGNKREDGVMTMPFPEYHAEVDAFFQSLGEFLILWTPTEINYREIANPLLNDHDAIATAGPDEVKALLTFAWRGERFCDGFWEGALQSGLVIAVLDRLHELRQAGQIEPIK